VLTRVFSDTFERTPAILVTGRESLRRPEGAGDPVPCLLVLWVDWDGRSWVESGKLYVSRP